MATHQPKIGDKVWDERRIAKGVQANGYIHEILKDGREISEIRVKFHDEKFSRLTFQTYSWEELQDAYTNERTGYMLHE